MTPETVPVLLDMLFKNDVWVEKWRGRIRMPEVEQMVYATSRQEQRTPALAQAEPYDEVSLARAVFLLIRFPPRVSVLITDTNEIEVSLQGQVGESLMEAARRGGVDIEGACGGCMDCTTCHVIVHPSTFAALPSPSEYERDVLDIASNVQDTSRLACQIALTSEMPMIRAALPRRRV